MIKKIDRFEGIYGFLSNFSRHSFRKDDILWPTVEHYYQAMKTPDKVSQGRIWSCPTPSAAKKLSYEVEIRENWEIIKPDVMLTALEYKFDQNIEIQKMLIDTGDAILIEGNHWHDNYWGDCKCDKCKNKNGQNVLGKLLMYVRRGYSEK